MYALAFSIKSDEKMKSVSTAFFMEIAFNFEMLKNDIVVLPPGDERDYKIWQGRKCLISAVELKKWVDPDKQRDLAYYYSGEKIVF